MQRLSEDIEFKEVAELRWKYLLQSERYKGFCLKQRQYKGERDIQYVTMMMDGDVLGRTFLMYGDIHSKSFDDYWKQEIENQKLIKYFKSLPCSQKVLKYDIGIDVNEVIRQYKMFFGKEPTIEELKQGLITFQNGRIEHMNMTFLLISGVDTIEDANDVTKEIGKILKKGIVRKRFVKAELERYLRVYIMRKNKIPFREIHQKEFSKDNYTDDHRRARISDYNKARKIISNVENNLRYWW